jgi:hypothetical protein
MAGTLENVIAGNVITVYYPVIARNAVTKQSYALLRVHRIATSPSAPRNDEG